MLQLRTDALAFSRFDSGCLFHHYIGIHLHQPPLRVVDEASVAALRNQPFARGIIQPDVEHGFHHPRHRGAGTRPH